MKKFLCLSLVLAMLTACQQRVENPQTPEELPKTSEKIHVEIMKEPPLGGSFFATSRVMKPLTEREILAPSHIMIVISTIHNDISATKNDISDVRSFKFCSL